MVYLRLPALSRPNVLIHIPCKVCFCLLLLWPQIKCMLTEFCPILIPAVVLTHTDTLGDKPWTHWTLYGVTVCILGAYSPFVSWEMSLAFGQLIKFIFLCFLDSVFIYASFTYRDCIDYSPRSSTLLSIFSFSAKPQRGTLTKGYFI